MEKDFNPYYKWLGIPPRDQPPNLYRLLGIEVFEEDRDVIDAAANRVMGYLKDLAVGDEAQYSQKLLNEVSRARLCLLNQKKKADYDAELRVQLAARPGEGQGQSGNGAGPPTFAPPRTGVAAEPAVPAALPPVVVATPGLPGPEVRINTGEGVRHVRKSKGESSPAASGPSRRLLLLVGVLLGVALLAVVVLFVSRRWDPSGSTASVTLDSEWPVRVEGQDGAFSGGTGSGGSGDSGSSSKPVSDPSGRDPGQTSSGTQTGPSGSDPAAAAGDPASRPSKLQPLIPPHEQGPNSFVGPSDLPVRSDFEDPSSVSPHPSLPPTGGSASSSPAVPATPPDPAPADPRTVATNPFGDLPAAVTLPELETAGAASFPLGAVHLQPQDACAVSLSGGQRAARGAGHFSIRASGGESRRWEFLFGADDKTASLADLSLDAGGQLSFGWTAAAAGEPLARHLSNCCLLLVGPEGSASHVLRLREPTQQEAIQIDLSKHNTKEDLQLDHPPQAESIIVQVLGLDGAQAKLDVPVSTDADGGQMELEVVEGGGLLLLEIKVQLKRTLQLEITPRLRSAAGQKPDVRDQRTVARKLEDDLKSVAVGIQQLRVLQQADVSRMTPQQRLNYDRQAIDAQLKMAEAQLLQLQELQTLLAAREKKLGLRLRVYYQADSERVDLLYAGEQGI